MIIDVHAHFLPESAVAAFHRRQPWHGTTFDRAANGVPVAETDGRRFVFGSPMHFEPIENRIHAMDQRGIDTEILSILPPLLRYELDAATATAAARDVNEELSDLTRRYPDRFLGFAVVPLQDVEASIDELERALSLPGIVGAIVGTHVAGSNLHAPELRPFFEAADGHGALLFVHPIAPRDRGALDDYYLRNVIGNPFETTAAAAGILLSGMLERLPRLCMCLAHGGGYLPAALGRLDHAFEVRVDAARDAEMKPTQLHRRFLYDTLTHSDRHLRFLVDAVGVDRVVLGSDFPADMGPADPVGVIRSSSSFTEAEKAAMLGENLLDVIDFDTAGATMPGGAPS